ncbi:AAEL002373-PA [Aedes aegypti]|uniref:AAEL002373-PA n=1 Tax=Aedes aegypti TaxID=7159 RepID=Q17IF8_AEDAE|nr:AAEL002373-PA [Aedes aegypti]
MAELPQFVHDAVAKIAAEQGFTNEANITFESGSNKGDGFASDMFRAIVQQEGHERLFVICKLPPLNEARRRQFNSMLIFERETLVYNTLLPKMMKFQRDKGIIEDEGFFSVAKCYMAVCDAQKEEAIIAMEDLRRRNMNMWNKLDPVNYEHVRMMMIQLGRFHAVSFALKEQRPDLFETFKVPDLMSKAMAENEMIKTLLSATMDRVIGVLNEQDHVARRKMQALKDNYMETVMHCCNGEKAEPFAVLAHGDCWINNIMFTYKNKKPMDLTLLDWQGARYVSPAIDLSYFFFCCTDEEFRRKHYDEMLRVYHNSLSELLEKLGGDPASQFPFTALLRQLTRYGCYGVLMAAFVLPVICTPNEDVPDLNASAERYQESQEFEANTFATYGASEQNFHRRMAGVVRDMIRFGYI